MTDTKRTLSLARQQLIELMQEIHYGRIEGLVVRDGEPVLNPPPRITRDIVFGKDNGAHAARTLADFVLKDQHVQLFRCFEAEATLQIQTLIVQAGLPVRMSLSTAL